MDERLTWTLLIAGAYLAGSIPFSYVIGRMHGKDLRYEGSRNLGATNVGRVIGRNWGMICFVLDFLKGAVPVFIAGLTMGLLGGDTPQPPGVADSFLWSGVLVAAITGHMASIFMAFKGGKGVATGFGAAVALYPWFTFPILGCLVLWLLIIRLTKLVSLASILAALALPLGIFLAAIPRDLGANPDVSFSDAFHVWPFLAVSTLMALIIAWKHRTNITRLLAGTEPRLGDPVVDLGALPPEASGGPPAPDSV